MGWNVCILFKKFIQSNLILLRQTSVEHTTLGAIQVLRNADGGGGVSDFVEKSVTKV